MTRTSPVGRRVTMALAIFALIAVPLGAHVLGYFWLGERMDYHHSGAGAATGSMTIERTYTYEWMATT